MTKGNLPPNGQDSAFSQAVAFRDESPFGQNIELSTLKFADESPSVDENMAEWLLSSGQSTTPSTSGVTQNPPPFDVSVSLTDGPSSFDSEKSIQNNCFSSLNSGLDNGTSPQGNSSIYENNGNMTISTPNNNNNNNNNDNNHQYVATYSNNSTEPFAEYSHNVVDRMLDDDTESMASAGDGHNQMYQEHDQQTFRPHAQFNTGGNWEANNQSVSLLGGDRRLPDVVTIDQCYRENEENECSTICLIANIESLKKEENVTPDAQQANTTRRGVQDRKERTSLRRGVMMRQMSINPDVHPDLSLISDVKTGGEHKTSTDGGGYTQESLGNMNINKAQETSAVNVINNYNNNNNNNNNNNLSVMKGQARKCSFSRNIIPPTVVIEDESETEGNIKDTITDIDKRRESYIPHQNSSSGRPKMKHLSQNSSSSAAMRFRLTFDESADAAANTVIGLPDEVSPHHVAGKRPSCICGEPELPREYLPESDSGLLRTDQCPLIISRTVSPSPMCGNLNNVASPHIPDCNNSYESAPIRSNNSAFTSICQSEAIPHNDSNHHSEPFVNTPFVQGQTEQTCHPHITIRISNSQQSFTPLLSDSPIPSEGSLDTCDSHGHSFHHNDKDNMICGRENSVSPYPDSHYSYHANSYSMRPYNSDQIPSEATQLLADHFHTSPNTQQSDTVQAPPIQDLYRYHVFFSHCPEDRDWVEHMVAHLESPPFNYTCAYMSIQDEDDQATLQQRILCAAMLSERVVLVLSSKYVQDTWFSFEKTLKQLTQMSLHNQRIMGVLLEDCVIPDSLGELYFLDACDPDFFHVFTKRLKTSRIPRSSASVSSDLGQNALAPTSVTNGKVLTFCRLQVKVGWDSYLVPPDDQEADIPPSLTEHGIGMEKTEFGEIVTKVSGIVDGSNKLPWLLSARPMVALLLAGGLWIPAFIAVLVIHVDDDSGIALPIRLGVFLYPLGLVAAGYLIKWRRAYWLTKIVRLLVQNCIDVNQALYFQGRPLFTTAAHVKANIFAIYFVYFDATDCVRSVDLLLITCMEDDWDKLLRLITFYTRDENYLSRMSVSERLTVMMSAPYLVKLVRQVLPHPPQQRHVSRLLCLCQFTEECISRFAHGFDREDVPGLAELFTRHLPGKVSGSAVRRVQEELFHANHGLVP